MTLPYPADLYPGCPCLSCMSDWSTFMRMPLCPTCGNKRCPGAGNHTNTCSGSNDPNHPGNH